MEAAVGAIIEEEDSSFKSPLKNETLIMDSATKGDQESKKRPSSVKKEPLLPFVNRPRRESTTPEAKRRKMEEEEAVHRQGLAKTSNRATKNRASILAKKSRLEALEKEEETLKLSLEKLRGEKNEKVRREKKKFSVPVVKFPVPDELIVTIEPTKPSQPLPVSSELPGVPANIVQDLLEVWDFLYTFSKEMVMSPLRLEDLVSLLDYKQQPSVALTDLFLSLLRFVLDHDGHGHSMRRWLYNTKNFANRGTPDSEDESVAGRAKFNDTFNGLHLLPPRLRPDLLTALFWPCVLRAILFQLEPVQRLQQTKVERNVFRNQDNDPSMPSPNVDSVLGVTASDLHGTYSMSLIREAATQLERLEPHQLTLEHKLTLLKLLCLAAYDTEHVQRQLTKNAEDRLVRQAEHSKLEKGRKKAKDLPAALRAYVIERVREANKAKAKKKGAKTELSTSKDPYDPTPSQLAAAMEEGALLQALGIDRVIPTLPQLVVPEDEGNGEDEPEEGGRRKRNTSTRSTGSAAQEAKEKIRLRADAEEKLEAALEFPGGPKAKYLREAIRFAIKAGLQGQVEDRSDHVFCTELLLKAHKAIAEIEAKAAELENSQGLNKALAESFVRTEPLGLDRHFRQYWNFDGDDRLWVCERQWVGGDPTSALSNDQKAAVAAFNLDESGQRLFTRRPSMWRTRWTVYASAREVWNLYDALDMRGERELALKAEVESRVAVEEPPSTSDYKTDGSEFLGRQVLRRFGKRTVLGTISSWLPAEGADPPLWHVHHLDGDEEDLELHEVTKCLVTGEQDPTVVTHYCNDAIGARSSSALEIGISGLKTEMLVQASALSAGLKSRGSSWGKDSRRAWDTAIKNAETAADLKPLLLELEERIRAVQTEEDVCEEDEVEDLTAEERTLRIAEMKSEGWIFGAPGEEDPEAETSDEIPFLSVRCRRFFPNFGASDGTVTAYLPAAKNDGIALWHMLHEDGDEEDLDETDVKAAIAAMEQDLLEDPSGGDVQDEEEGMEVDTDGDEEENADRQSKSKLWPSLGVRQRWRKAVSNAATVSELALGLSSLMDYANDFGVVSPDSTDSALIAGKRQRKSRLSSAIWGQHSLAAPRDNAANKSGQRNRGLSHLKAEKSGGGGRGRKAYSEVGQRAMRPRRAVTYAE